MLGLQIIFLFGDLPGLVHSLYTRLKSQLILENILRILIALFEHLFQGILSRKLIQAALGHRQHNILVDAQTGNFQIEDGFGIWYLDHTGEGLCNIKA